MYSRDFSYYNYMTRLIQNRLTCDLKRLKYVSSFKVNTDAMPGSLECTRYFQS